MKARLLGATIALSLFVSPASAEIVVLYYTGIVEETLASDGSGASLVGDTYNAAYIFDTSKGIYWDHPPTPGYIDVYGGTQYQSQSPLILETFTINHQTQFLTSPGYGELILCSVCVGANAGLEEVGAASDEMTNIVYAESDPVQFPPSLDTSEFFSVVSNTADGQGSRGQFWPDSLELLPQTVDVLVLTVPTTPLPAALPLFATGLGVMGLFGWRKRRSAPCHTLGASTSFRFNDRSNATSSCR